MCAISPMCTYFAHTIPLKCIIRAITCCTPIEKIVSSYPDPQQAADALVQAALDAGGLDNVSVIVVKAG